MTIVYAIVVTAMRSSTVLD